MNPRLLVATLLLASATAVAAPVWKHKETVVSSWRCTGTGSDASCDVHSSAKVRIATSIAAVAPGLPADTQFTVAIGQSTWTAPLSTDPKYAAGATRAVLTLARDPDTSKPTVVATLRWTKTGVKVTVSAAVPVASESFVYDPSTGAGKVDLPLRACAQLGAARVDFGVRIRGTQATTKFVSHSADGDETHSLPQVRLSGNGGADPGDAPPLVAATIARAGDGGPAELDPVVDVSGSAVSGSAIARVTTQLDSAPETDVAAAPPVAFPCGGVQRFFAAEVQIGSPGTHTVTVRAYDDLSRVASASARFVLAPPKPHPQIERILLLDKHVPNLAETWPLIAMIDDHHRLWIQRAVKTGSGEDVTLRPLASAEPAGLDDVADVQNYTFDLGPNDSITGARWIALRTGGTVAVGGKTVQGLPQVKTLAWQAGYGEHSGLALSEDGHVWAWGANRFGQLGDGTKTAREQPAEIAGLSDVTRIVSTGDGERFALTSSGALYAWGLGSEHHRGDTSADPTVPGLVPLPKAVTEFVLDSNSDRLYARADDGTVIGLAWGPSFGYFGDGHLTETATGSFFPARTVASLSGISHVLRDSRTGRTNQAFAIRSSDGALLAWGDDEDGTCGLPTAGPVLTPAVVPIPSNGVADVRQWITGVVALTSAGEVWEWGEDAIRIYLSSQSGGPPFVRTPVQVVVPPAAQVEIAYNRAYCRTTDGRVFTWDPGATAFEPREILFDGQ